MSTSTRGRSGREIGVRVGAILGAGDDKVVEFLGYGIYEGDFLPPGSDDQVEAALPITRATFAAQAALDDSDLRNTFRRFNDAADEQHRVSDEELERRVAAAYETRQQQGRYDDEQIREWLRTSSMLANPRIRLDNGKVVWGRECWWGPEADVAQRLDAYRAQGWEVATVDIDDARRRAGVGR